MDSFRKNVERSFDTGSTWLTELSDEWRVHSNRRTILIIIFTGVLLATAYVSIIQPPRDFPLGTLVLVEEGASLDDTARSLEEQRVVRSALALKLWVRLTGDERNVHAGDYLFKEPENLFTIARALAKGYFGLEPYKIRIPEGATTKDMARMFGYYLERFDTSRFLEAAQPIEGFLFPDTYFFMPNTTDEQVVKAMRENFDTHVKLLSREIVAFGKPLEEVVIMASLLEREAHNTEDRRIIAGVLWNRIKRDMLLQVDAAFLYTLGKGTFDLTAADLKSDDPYNTYVNKGLPPGAIGSPSLDSLRAAVTPVQHDYLFYLADHENVTHYAKTYEEHLANKGKYLDSQ